NYDLAIFNYKQALMFQPENIDAREKLRATQTKKVTQEGGNAFVGLLKAFVPLLKAQMLTLFGKNDSAILACEDALSAKPDSVFAMKLIAKNALANEWHELACWQLREVLHKHDPENVDVMYDLVEALEEIEEVQEAIELCEQIRELNPDADIDGRIRELAAGQTATVFATAATKGAHSMVKDEDERRELEIESQIARTDEARDVKIKGLQKKYDERPDDYRILLRIGDEYYNYDNFAVGYEKAHEAYIKAQELMPSDHNIKVKLGELEIKKLRVHVRELQAKAKEAGTDEAKKAYIEALKELRRFQIKEYEERVYNQPLRMDYRHNLGKLYQETKQYDKAIAEFQQSCRDPKHAIDAYTSMGQCFVELDQVDVGIDMLHKAMDGQEVFSKIRDTVFNLGDALERNGDKAEALKQYSRVFEDDITYKDVRKRVERLRLELRDEKRAQEDADKS
ncbi:MAG: tetratricopeptide repeat protein, partial [Planctomycetota bacterium]